MHALLTRDVEVNDDADALSGVWDRWKNLDDRVHVHLRS